MSRLTTLALGASFFVGLVSGLAIIRVPYLTLKQDVDIVALATLVMMIAIAILIPMTITYRIDTMKSRKNLVITDIEKFCHGIRKICTSIPKNRSPRSTHDLQTEITYVFKKGRIDLRSIKTEVMKFNSSRLNTIANEVDSSLESYWKYVTGGESVMENIKKVDFYWKQSAHSDQVQRKARKLAISINDV